MALSASLALGFGHAVPAGEHAGIGKAALYPAAQCAALWFGYDDLARVSGFLERNSTDPVRARAFLDVAYRLDDGDTGDVDDYVERQRRLMSSMIGAMIHDGDRQSRDLFDRLTRTCSEFAAQHPETEALR